MSAVAIAQTVVHASRASLPYLAVAGRYMVVGACTAAIIYLAVKITQWLISFLASNRFPRLDGMVATLQEALQSHGYDGPLPQFDNPQHLMFEHGAFARKANAESLQDVTFYFPSPNEGFIWAGMVDGHGERGADFADEVSHSLGSKISSDMLQGDVEDKITKVFHQVQEELMKTWAGEHVGAAVCGCLIDVRTGRAYVVTLGHPGAKVIRRKGAQTDLIPLSPIRNWAHEEEAARAFKANPMLRDEWNGKDWARRKYPGTNVHNCINLSRCFGNSPERIHNGEPVILATPLVTVFPLQKGDELVIATHSVWAKLPQNLLAGHVALQDAAGSIGAEKITEWAQAQLNKKEKASLTAVSIYAKESL